MSEKQKTDDNKFGTGAVRSADADHLDFMSMPLIGLVGVARTAFEGGSKYGRYNYMQGMPAHVCVNHAFRHLVLWAMGDRSEPHLSHAAWNCMTAEQSCVLNPELNAPHLPGPGYALTPEILAHLAAEAPKLAEKRQDKEWLKTLGGWVIGGLSEIKTILDQRRKKEWLKVVNATMANYIRETKRYPYGRKGDTIPAHEAAFAGQIREMEATAKIEPGQVVLINEDVEPGAGTTEHITFTNEEVVFDTRRLDKDGRPIPQSLWIYLKDKVGVRYVPDAPSKPSPEPGESWCDFDDGSRLYWQDEASRLASVKASRPYAHPSGLADNDPRRHITGIVGQTIADAVERADAERGKSYAEIVARHGQWFADRSTFNASGFVCGPNGEDENGYLSR